MSLDHYRNIVATLASIATILQMFSGVFVCRDIIKQGTKHISALPFIGGFGMSVLFLKYSQIIKDTDMVAVNIVGIILNIAYLLCYYFCCHEKVQFVTTLSKSALFFGSIIAYVQWEDEVLVQFRFGLIVTVLLLLLIASPLLHLDEVIRTKSTATLPFPIILSSTVVSFLWLLYGIIIDDAFIQIQNLIGVLLSAVQLSLFFIYPSQPSIERKRKSS